MEFANASKLDRKSGVRFGEPGAPVCPLPPVVTSAFVELQRFQVEGRGIPHLAKNERDVGHPWFCCQVISQS
jgi:hypothetical protein